MARKIPCMDDSLKGRQNTQPWRIATLDISRKQRQGVTEARPGKTMFGVDPVLGSRRWCSNFSLGVGWFGWGGGVVLKIDTHVNYISIMLYTSIVWVFVFWNISCQIVFRGLFHIHHELEGFRNDPNQKLHASCNWRFLLTAQTKAAQAIRNQALFIELQKVIKYIVVSHVILGLLLQQINAPKKGPNMWNNKKWVARWWF